MKNKITSLLLTAAASLCLCLPFAGLAQAGGLSIITPIATGATNAIPPASTNALTPGASIYNPTLNTVDVSLTAAENGSATITNTLILDGAILPGLWQSNLVSTNFVCAGTATTNFLYSLFPTNTGGGFPYYQVRVANTSAVYSVTSIVYSTAVLKPKGY